MRDQERRGRSSPGYGGEDRRRRCTRRARRSPRRSRMRGSSGGSRACSSPRRRAGPRARRATRGRCATRSGSRAAATTRPRRAEEVELLRPRRQLAAEERSAGRCRRCRSARRSGPGRPLGSAVREDDERLAEEERHDRQVVAEQPPRGEARARARAARSATTRPGSRSRRASGCRSAPTRAGA